MNEFIPDDRSAVCIATLLPSVQDKAINALKAFAESGRLPDGWRAKIIQGTRSYDQQTALYAQGRTAPGKVVTNAPAGYSLHNFGIAFDIGIFNEAGKYIDDIIEDADHYYQMLGPVGRGTGLEWGGDWQRFKDFPHFQFNPLHLTIEQLRQRHETGEDLLT
jgi:peptidoglycan L-alanyl-D-glutamate endopeptidase CwlK